MFNNIILDIGKYVVGAIVGAIASFGAMFTVHKLKKKKEEEKKKALSQNEKKTNPPHEPVHINHEEEKKVAFTHASNQDTSEDNILHSFLCPITHCTSIFKTIY